MKSAVDFQFSFFQMDPSIDPEVYAGRVNFRKPAEQTGIVKLLWDGDTELQDTTNWGSVDPWAITQIPYGFKGFVLIPLEKYELSTWPLSGDGVTPLEMALKLDAEEFGFQLENNKLYRVGKYFYISQFQFLKEGVLPETPEELLEDTASSQEPSQAESEEPSEAESEEPSKSESEEPSEAESKESKDETPKTGDNSLMMYGLLVLAVSSATIFVLIPKKANNQ